MNKFESREAFKAAYPDYHDGRDIEVFNLLLKREFAERIIAGEKKLEFRAHSAHYQERLYDKETLEFMALHENEQEVLDMCEPIRQINTIHFHNYNNSWSLDVECECVGMFALNEENVKYFQDEFDCHEMDDALKDLKAMRVKYQPLYFFFVLGEIKNRVNI